MCVLACVSKSSWSWMVVYYVARETRSGLHRDAAGGGRTLKASSARSRVDSHLHLELPAHIFGNSRSEGLLRQNCVCLVKCYLNDGVNLGVCVRVSAVQFFGLSVVNVLFIFLNMCSKEVYVCVCVYVLGPLSVAVFSACREPYAFCHLLPH